jgi:hypothetical protein
MESPVSSFVCMRPSTPAPPQFHKTVSVLAEVDAVAGAEVYLVFKDAGPDAFGLREIPLFHPRQRDGDLGCRRRVESFQPLGEAFFLFSSM